MHKKLVNIKNEMTFAKLFNIGFIIAAALLIGFIIFKSPVAGVADQGDFDRVMFGLSLKPSDAQNPDFDRFYHYIVTDYSINLNWASFLLILSGSTINYLILGIIFICKLFGQDIFKTQYIAIAYGIVYIFATLTIINNINFKSKINQVIFSLCALLIFFDGYYIIWFNSLYGEPVMLTTFLLFIGVYLGYINSETSEENKKTLAKNIIFVFIAAFLFLGAKMQVSTTLPFVVILLVKIIIDNKKTLSKKFLILEIIMLVLVIACPIKMSKQGQAQGKDTLYNSVFYGILNESDTPEQDLIDLGLNPDMACEAGKHAYLDKEDYVKYVPRTQITEDAFYSKMSNGKLAKFYLTHPSRLIKGMEYTADNAFYTSTSLGKHYRSYSEEPVTEFNRFTIWSSFREKELPKKLWFIVCVFVLTFAITIFEFVKNIKDTNIKNKIILVWMVLLSGAIQFPMPFVGNGRADTAKQLYLFNFVFDIMLLGLVSYIVYKIVYFIKLFARRKN